MAMLNDGPRGRYGGIPKKGVTKGFGPPQAPTYKGTAVKTTAPLAKVTRQVAPTTGGGAGGMMAQSAPAVAPAPAPTPAPTPPPPAPVNDVDWFSKDGLYRSDAGNNLANLTDALAAIMSGRDNEYNSIANNRSELGRNRDTDLTQLGNDFASRDMQGGFYAQAADKLAADYARFGADIDTQEQQVLQQYGKQGSQVDLKGLSTDNVDGRLQELIGALGSLGVNAGTSYQNAMTQARTTSAGRSADPLVNTFTW